MSNHTYSHNSKKRSMIFTNFMIFQFWRIVRDWEVIESLKLWQNVERRFCVMNGSWNNTRSKILWPFSLAQPLWLTIREFCKEKFAIEPSSVFMATCRNWLSNCFFFVFWEQHIFFDQKYPLPYHPSGWIIYFYSYTESRRLEQLYFVTFCYW